jgi:hypothetical protein
MKLVLPLAAASISIGAWVTAIPPVPPEQRQPAAGAPAPLRADTAALAASATRLRGQDPFRIDRKPADVRYDPWAPPPSAVAPAPAQPRPPLALAGLVGGPPWNAMIEGIPGREGGVLLQLGDSIGGVRFTALRGDTVFLTAFDTTWTLTARRPWR